MRMGIGAAAVPPLTQMLATSALAQDAGPDSGKIGAVGGRAETELYPGQNLPGGGQLEIRLTTTTYTSDPDQLEVAQRMKPFNLASWIEEWTRVAERNEEARRAARRRRLQSDGERILSAGFQLLSRSVLADAGDRFAHASAL